MAGSLQAACLRAAVLTLGGVLAALAAMPHLSGNFAGLVILFFPAQDAPTLLAAGVLLWALARFPLPRRVADWAMAAFRRPVAASAAIAAVAVGITAFGAFHGVGGFDVSRDEIMADFDATILRSGHLLAPIVPAWRPFHAALEPLFMLPIPPAAGWVSAYLPGNAAFRALVGLVVNPDWSGPILVAAAAWALFGIARRLWAGEPGVALVCMVLFAACPQVLVTGMTSYAMTIHLTVNLIWLWLLLRDDRRGHAGAMLTGFVGCGLHQFIFHPLFAAPFLLQLWRRGRHRLAVAYAFAYAVSILFWINYWSLLLPVGQHAESAVGGLYFMDRVALLLHGFSLRGVFPMVVNLMRFLAWEQVFALPLLLAAWPSISRGEGIARPLAGGLLLTTAAMLVLLPYQGHGWGYRYLHGLIGNVCLLGGYGWCALTAGRDARDSRAAVAALGAATAVSLCLLLPFKAGMAAAFIRPYRLAEAAIVRAPADVVLVDWSGLMFADDLVRNDPFLRNTPKVMDLAALDAAQIATVCRRFRVALFDRREARALGLREIDSPGADPAFLRARRAELERLHCGVPVPVGARGAP